MTAASGAGMRTLPGDFSDPGTRHVELVFRSVGERTSELGLEFAIKYIRPQRVHLIENVRPFALAVRRMLELPHATSATDCSHVVYMDADCLILEDMRGFLNANELPFVDCYVNDHYRGRVHCGIHITRVDVVRRMAELQPPENELAVVLRPESSLRDAALAELGFETSARSFDILHDCHQEFEDIFAKYALRELRSRTPDQRDRLRVAMTGWGPGADFAVAREAVAHAAKTVPEDSSPAEVQAYIENLPAIANAEVATLGLAKLPPLTRSEVDQSALELTSRTRPAEGVSKVFGIGLSHTGTKSLSVALRHLGIDTVHYPNDERTLADLIRGDGRLTVAEQFDGITDITTIPFLHEFDRHFPGAKYILTVRDESSWLASCRKHWAERPPFHQGERKENGTHMEVRRFLRAAVYGSYEFEEQRFARIAREHEQRVRDYFSERPADLLVLNIVGGEGWEKLAPFLGCDIPNRKFPHRMTPSHTWGDSLEMTD